MAFIVQAKKKHEQKDNMDFNKESKPFPRSYNISLTASKMNCYPEWVTFSESCFIQKCVKTKKQKQ